MIELVRNVARTSEHRQLLAPHMVTLYVRLIMSRALGVTRESRKCWNALRPVSRKNANSRTMKNLNRLLSSVSARSNVLLVRLGRRFRSVASVDRVRRLALRVPMLILKWFVKLPRPPTTFGMLVTTALALSMTNGATVTNKIRISMTSFSTIILAVRFCPSFPCIS